MNDRPDARELIDAVRGYLEQELLPSLTDARLRYQTLIAANVLAIAARELAVAPSQADEERAWLQALLGESGDVYSLNRKLCQLIRQGAFDDPKRFSQAVQVVRQIVLRKLEIANPTRVARGR